jgi:hypothetical protein
MSTGPSSLIRRHRKFLNNLHEFSKYTDFQKSSYAYEPCLRGYSSEYAVTFPVVNKYLGTVILMGWQQASDIWLSSRGIELLVEHTTELRRHYRLVRDA